jgi:hypothetical protein
VSEVFDPALHEMALSGNDEYPWKVSFTTRGMQCPKSAIPVWDFIPLAVLPQNSFAWIG